MYDAVSSDIDVESLPIARGYKILIYVPELKTTSKGGVHLPEVALVREKTASIVGKVIQKGPDCYRDAEKFPSGPYANEGDWVMFHSYAGTRFRVDGKEYRLINDDTVEAVVKNPDTVERA